MDIKENVGKQNTVFDWSMNVRDCFNNMGRPTNVITKETCFLLLIKIVIYILRTHEQNCTKKHKGNVNKVEYINDWISCGMG